VENRRASTAGTDGAERNTQELFGHGVCVCVVGGREWEELFRCERDQMERMMRRRMVRLGSVKKMQGCKTALDIG
jgi:hypothetical protein